MNKPTEKVKKSGYDYHDVIKYIEEKYSINVRDYAGLFKNGGHFNKWLKLTGETPPNYPSSPGGIYQVKIDGEVVVITKEEYDERFDVIHAQYKRYQEWMKDNPEPPYLDFWHWLLENDFSDISNGCYATLEVVGNINNESTPSWVREILQRIHDEYQEEEMEFWIEW